MYWEYPSLWVGGGGATRLGSSYFVKAKLRNTCPADGTGEQESLVHSSVEEETVVFIIVPLKQIEYGFG